MKPSKQFLYIPLLFLWASGIINANPEANTKSIEIEFLSLDTQVTMIELYTSEGCSSCPPAEARLNRYEHDDGLWQTIIPIAFHVDYWDYIGWRDRFASPRYGERQSRYAKLNHERTVYTPAFIVNGKNWRPGLIFSKSPEGESRRVGTLAVHIHNNSIHTRFKPVTRIHVPLELNIAVLGMDLSSDIKSGENSGRMAKHHFVVLAQKRIPGNSLNWKTDLPSLQGIHAPRYALVAWVSRQEHPAPLQAVGGYIPNLLVE